jgi:putative FmdB family regulatory protein
MPVYEYSCADCNTRMEILRPMSKADDPVECRTCSSLRTSRQISAFVAFSRGGSSPARPIAGAGGGCGSCAGGHCGSCGTH